MSMIANNGKKVCFILSNGNVVTKIMKDEKAIWELEGDMLLKFAVDVAKGTAIFYNDDNFLAPDDYKAGDYVYFSKGTFHPTTFRFAIGSSTFCNYYSEIYVLKDFDFSKVTSMWIFCYNMPLLTKLDISHLDTSNINDMNSSFRNLGVKKLDLSNFDTSKVTNMFMMFYNCTSLTSLDVSNFDTSKVTNMGTMFSNCSSLTSLDVSNFDTSKATYVDHMFNNCSSLTSLDVSNFDTSEATTMYYMFYNCTSLTSLDLSHFNTSKVTSMSSMFSSCASLTNLIFGSKWGTQTSTEANALTLDLSYLGSSKSYKLTDDTYNSMLTMYDRASNGLATMTIKFSKKHNLPDGFAEKMSALGYTITLV